MNTSFKLTSFIMILLAFQACNNKATGTKAKTGTAQATPTTSLAKATTYQLNSGILNWTGSKALGSAHQGTINISQGTIGVTAGGKITTGNFMIDMNSITNTDMKAGQGKEKLEGHLKAGDFFDVAKFPTGSFNIVKVEAAKGVANVTHNVIGNLILKGIKKTITIPANIAVGGGNVTAVSPSFTIDRTEWGIQYGSGSIVGLAKDKVINNDIALVLELSASVVNN